MIALVKGVAVFGGSLLSVDLLGIGHTIGQELVTAGGAVLAASIVWRQVIRPAIHRALSDALNSHPLFDPGAESSLPARLRRLEQKESADVRVLHHRIDRLTDRP